GRRHRRDPRIVAPHRVQVPPHHRPPAAAGGSREPAGGRLTAGLDDSGEAGEAPKPCRMVLTGAEDSTTTAASAAELAALAAAHVGSTVTVGVAPALADAFLARVVGLEAGPRPGLAVRAGATSTVDVGPDGRGVIRTLNGDLALAKLAEEAVAADRCRVVIARHGQAMAVEDGEPVYSHHPIGLTAP